MEYTGYTEQEILKDKKKNTRGLVLLALPILLGLFMLIGGISGIFSIELNNANQTPYTEIEYAEDYYFEELVLVEAYGYIGNSTLGPEYADSKYYLVRFTDGEGNLVYASLCVDSGDYHEEICDAYMADDSQRPGDVVLSGVFFTGGSPRYENATAFNQIYSSYILSEPGQQLDQVLSYRDFETAEDYRSKKMSGESIFFIFAAVFLLPSGISIFLLIRKRKELNQYLQEARARQSTPEGDFNYGIFHQDSF